MQNTKRDNTILRSAEILRCISSGAERIIDIADRSDLSMSTVHRLLTSLKQATFVQQDAVSKRYYLGSFIHSLISNPIILHKALIISSHNEMEHLTKKTRETVTLTIPVGINRICLEVVESPEALRSSVTQGSTLPLYAGAAGKVLMSEMNDKYLEMIFQRISFTQFQKNTITNKESLLENLRSIREQGYATSNSEIIAGSASISVPIKNYICPVALSVMGPENRLGPKMINFVNTLQSGANKISQNLAKVRTL